MAVAAPSSRIIGVDRSEPYVAIARTHHQSHRRLFQVGDAQHLPLRGASFDRVLSLLTLNFVPDPATALGEMIRVTRAGGTVAAAVWDYGEGMEMLRVFWDEAITLAAHADEKDERHMPLSRSGELGRLWGLHRLHTVVETSLTIETEFSSFADYWSPFLQQQGPAGAHVATLSASERAQLESKLRRRLLDERPDGPITLRARAWAVRGVVPSPA